MLISGVETMLIKIPGRFCFLLVPEYSSAQYQDALKKSQRTEKPLNLLFAPNSFFIP